ncbi:MAG: LCP family protein [Candidatus Limnocylindrales bacterium]
MTDLRDRLVRKTATPTGGDRSTTLAAFLSLLWPGLGQWYLRRRGAALAYALPTALAMGALVWQLGAGLETFALRMLTPTFALNVLILILLLAIVRIVAMLDAAFWRGPVAGTAPDGHRGRVAVAALTAMIALVVVSHGAAGYAAFAFYDAGSKIFIGASDGNGVPGPTDASATLDPNAFIDREDFQATPDATPSSASARVTVLLTGIDSGGNRDHTLTDTLLIVSIDPTTGKVVMVSFPRDIAGFPLYTGATYAGRINTLMSAARNDPKRFPDGPLPTLTRELSYLLGVPIHYFAAINLTGFIQMIDLVGGVDVVNPSVINDPTYDWLDGTRGFYLRAGKVHLNGRNALGFVRSRHGAGDSDFTRAANQQLLLVALRQKLLKPAMILRLPDLLAAASNTVTTNFPSDRVDQMVALAQSGDPSTIQRLVLGPPYSWHPDTSTTGGAWLLRLNMDKLAALSVQLFGSDSRYFSAATTSP